MIKEVKFKFVDPNKYFGGTNAVNDEIITFYQVCHFENPETKKYEIKKYFVNQNNEIVNFKFFKLDKNEHDKFIKLKPPNKYKLYSVYSLSMIKNPTLDDIETSRSRILN